MRISKKSQYGLRAMVYLVTPRVKNKVCSLREISNKEKIPFLFFRKNILKIGRSKTN